MSARIAIDRVARIARRAAFARRAFVTMAGGQGCKCRSRAAVTVHDPILGSLGPPQPSRQELARRLPTHEPLRSAMLPRRLRRVWCGLLRAESSSPSGLLGESRSSPPRSLHLRRFTVARGATGPIGHASGRHGARSHRARRGDFARRHHRRRATWARARPLGLHDRARSSAARVRSPRGVLHAASRG